MNDLQFDGVIAKLRKHYHAGEYNEVLNLATRFQDEFHEQDPMLRYWQMAMSAQIGDTRQALELLREALQGGLWYGEALLRDSPSFESLQSLPAFEHLVELNQALREAEQERAFACLTLRPEGQCLSGEAPCPTLIALHANGSNSAEIFTFLAFSRQCRLAGRRAAILTSDVERRLRLE